MTDKFPIDENTIGDIVFVRLKNKTGLYGSVVDHENKLIVTKTIFEAKDESTNADICDELDIPWHGDDAEEEERERKKWLKKRRIK